MLGGCGVVPQLLPKHQSGEWRKCDLYGVVELPYHHYGDDLVTFLYGSYHFNCNSTSAADSVMMVCLLGPCGVTIFIARTLALAVIGWCARACVLGVRACVFNKIISSAGKSIFGSV